MESSMNFDRPGIASRKKWDCRECGSTNEAGTISCKKCGHEPTGGRRDVDPEGRRYDPSSEYDHYK